MLMRTNEQFLAIGDAEFIEDAGEVMSNCDARNAKAVSDILVGKAFADEAYDLAFSFG